MIDSMEGQDVSTDDIPGSFLQTYYDKVYIYIKMEGGVVTLIKYNDPS